MAGHINTFIGGMDKDTSKQKYSNSKYVDANNIRPITDEGLSSGAIENIAGNKFAIDFPEIIGVATLDITALATDDDNTTKTITNFTIETGYNQTKIYEPSITFINATDLLDKIEALIVAKNNTLPEQLRYKYGRLNSIDRITLYNYATPITSMSADIYHTPEIFATSRDFIVIGSADLRDDIILFTKNQTGQLDFGQIWRFSYNVARPGETAYYNLELIYTGAVNFSLEHPIDAKAYYENEETQKVYWTDYNETLRGCDLKDPNTFAFRAQEFSLTPETELSPAIAGRKNHTSGNLDSGLWYTTYRLSRIGGGVTGVAPFSAGIPIIVDDPTVGIGGNDTDYHTTNYTVTSVPTTKSIEFTIFDIPKGHDQIVIYAVHEKSPGSFTTYLYEEQFLTDATELSFNISDTSVKEVIPFTSLVDINVEFEKVKTITIKDNSLLAGNVTLANFDLDYDARAYRFRPRVSGNRKTYIGNGTDNTLTTAQLADKNWEIGLKNDVINPYNTDLTIEQAVASGTPLTDLDYSYKIDGITKGGTGPNISYEFTSHRFPLDNSRVAKPRTQLGATNTDFNYNSAAPFVNNIAENNVIKSVNGNEIDIGPGFSNFKNPTFEAYFKGYMRDEVYRFGIVFYSKTGKPSEVKWIADIRFPSAGDGEEDSEGFEKLSLGQYTTYSNGYIGQRASDDVKVPGTQDGGTFGHTVGIKFDVDISDIREEISGYSIVRAPRREKDRTIIAEGVLSTVDGIKTNIPNSGTTTPAGNTLYNGGWKQKDMDTSSIFIHDSIKDTSTAYDDFTGAGYTNREPKWEFGTLDCPDLKFITGAKLNGFKNRTENSGILVDNYKLKPVALYAAAKENIVTDVTENGRIFDSYVGTTSAVKSEDIYSNATVLVNSCSTLERYTTASTWGSLRDIFFVDHGNGADTHVEVDTVYGTTVNFFNGGILDIVGGSTRQEALGGIGTRTVLFQGHDTMLAKRLINMAGGATASTDFDPYAEDGFGQSNNLHNWSYRQSNAYDSSGMYAVVDIYRHLENQYGGDTFLARQNTEYISTGHFTKVNKESLGVDVVSSEEIYGGDINTNLWTEKKFYTYENYEAFIWSGDNGSSGTSPRMEHGSIRGIVIPMQSIVNTELRPLIHFNNYNSVNVSANDIAFHRRNPDEYSTPVLYHKEKTTQTYLVEGAGADLITEYDNRAYLSNVKSNGELIDSWSTFESHNFKDVNGEYGPINKLETFNDNVVFFQDKAFGTLAVNPRSVVQDTGGTDLVFGVGGGIVDYNYVSNTVGAFHQWGVKKTQTGIYFFDALHKKIYAFSGGNSPLSDLKGMSSWCYNKILNNAVNDDNPILFKGVTTAYDQRFNEVLFTFHFYKDAQPIAATPSIEDLLAGIPTTEPNPDTGINTGVLTGNTGSIGIPTTTTDTTDTSNPVPVYTTTYPETDTRIWNDPLMTNGLYKISITGTQLVDIQDLLSLGSELYMTLPDGTYVPVSIVSTNTPGYVYVSSSQFGVWDAEFSPIVRYREIKFKCTKVSYETATISASGNVDFDLISTTPNNNPTTVTVTESITTPNVDAFPVPESLISYTLVYNELTQAFTSFYSHWPRHYFTNGRRIFSQDPSGYGLYVHDEGNRGQFYGNLYDSDLELMINPKGTHTKVFNNIEYLSQVYDNNGVNLTDVTLDRARFFNEYQDTQTVILDPTTNIKRRMRTWRMQIPRDNNARIRNSYMGTKVSFTNTANRRLVLHDVTTYYMDTPM
jgi:hypothetical protein